MADIEDLPHDISRRFASTSRTQITPVVQTAGVRDPQSGVVVLGHDLEDTADPVVARWHVLRIDRPEPDHDKDYSLTRQGPGVLEGLRYVLSPQLDLQI
jgi:hypothetical protein